MVTGIVLLLAGALIVVMAIMAGIGKLGMNPLVGIRVAPLMRSEEAWRIGHKAGAPALIVAGIGAMIGGIACFFISSDDTVGIVALVSAAWLIAFTLGASLVAVRAVKSVR
ncbi:SdpI family protein [Brevibacterium sp. 91QC2O2]|uniref:SdpI family protein n=1 Tax=Brevibacterium sp. 91QC2O2 TaxID=2968458 RepID=UPI00211BCF7B|nr:SdpI family protein [Brevibacterium sp. 91QC2O2]MCQ9367819.1 SdpI family protein [Brevibacterium sp. 91QC2O2]